MDKSLHSLTMFMHSLFLILYVFHLTSFATKPFSSNQASLTHDDDCSALFQFKQSFSINEFASFDISAYSKTASWKLNSSESSSVHCCLWDGVECSEEDSGHVIGLDLRSSFLYGTINSSSTLFSLIHLQRINLADNDFKDSQIPSEIGRLSQLTSLNLSFSAFSGQIPKEISQLTQLVSLDLSQNSLRLQTPSFRNLVQNLTGLEDLILSYVDMSSEVPHILANLSSLRLINLRDCGLYGEFPTDIFNLPKLKSLSVRFNQNLTGYLPEFHRSSPLERLLLAGTSFSGKIPASIGNLQFLSVLDLSNCSFSGFLPASIGNLQFLSVLDLSNCSFSGFLPASIGNLTQLTYLGIESTQFKGHVPSLTSLSQLTYLDLSSNIFDPMSLPSLLANLTKLTSLYLYTSNLYGKIPSSLANLTQLREVDLHDNQLQGPIPSLFSNLINLEVVSLTLNNLTGAVESDIFLNLKKLTLLQLGGNGISFLDAKNYTNATLPKFEILTLDSCNLRAFPEFLRFQDKLQILSLANNKIKGQVPEKMLNVGKDTLELLDLSENLLTGFDRHPQVLPWVRLKTLDLGSNLLQGSLPVPPPSTSIYNVADNRLTGPIPPSVCQLNSLQELILSNNRMTGTIPPCLGNMTNSLSVLDFKSNNFRGTIPNTYTKECKLKAIDLSENQFDGQVPRSLTNCITLQHLDFGDNLMDGTFPFWLAALPELKVLILRSNKFHGALESPTRISSAFLKLRIVDLSNNGFTGDLPQGYFQSWMAMKTIDADTAYLETDADAYGRNVRFHEKYSYSMTMTNKGVKTEYEKILNIFTAVDLSSNKFTGKIPESVGSLQGLQLLNLSNNSLYGRIPTSLGNLTKLESLDLSLNMLLGEIPPQLEQLGFLAFLNVSYNNLTGRIPQGKQFNTFQNNSYEGNSGLCGEPLSKKCGNSQPSATPPLSDDSESFPNGVDWIVRSLGLGSGLVVGLIIGQRLTSRHHEWFVEKFGKRRRQINMGRRN